MIESSRSAPHIVPVSADAVRPLRLAVLRPHQGPEEVVWPGDDAPGTLHVGARDGHGELVGVATVVAEPHPDDPRPGDWRVRGMATAPGLRDRGIGRALLQALLEHARASGGARVWCTARIGAAGFYDRAGFVAEGDVLDLPGIGPHLVMALPLR
jgi:ribosomal protein S18 acetylase RimI-like enzyme